MNLNEDNSLALANKLAQLHLSDSSGSSGVRPENCQSKTENNRVEGGGWIAYKFNNQTSTLENLEFFISRYPPSRITNDQCEWIAIANAVDRDTVKSSLSLRPPPSRIDEMKAAFRALATSHRKDGNITLTVSSLDRLAREYNVTSGKWLIFSDQENIDMLWAKVVHLVCMVRKRGSAKVSPNKGDGNHVICVYVKDFSDMEDVMGLRKDLRSIGVTQKIRFKMDAYTHLEIYGSNSWGIRPSRYCE